MLSDKMALIKLIESGFFFNQTNTQENLQNNSIMFMLMFIMFYLLEDNKSWTTVIPIVCEGYTVNCGLLSI